MTRLDHLARDLSVSGRSLRRAANCGLIRVHRPSPRKLSLSVKEENYLRSHWATLSALLQVLRTQHNVRLAVVFGSVARGDVRPDSDVDLFVDLREDNYRRRSQLSELVSNALGRRVDLLSWNGALNDAALVNDILRDGRVLVDRDAHWQGLQAKRAEIRRAAVRQTRQLLADEAAALVEIRAAALA